MSVLSIDVDVDQLLGKQLTALEQRQLPYAAIQAANNTALEIQYQWRKLLQTRLDAPVRLTLNSVYVTKARYVRGGDGARASQVAEVYIRDQAAKGTAPANYLMPQVFGGVGHDKGLERGLRRAGYLRAGEYAVAAADNTLLDSHGNIRNGVVQQIIAQLGGAFDAYGNETLDDKQHRNRKARGKSIKQARGRRFFAVSLRGKQVGTVGKTTSHLSPGVYVRDGKHDLSKIFHFTSQRPTYQPRLDLFGAAERAYNQVMPFFLERQLGNALADARARGWT